MKEIVLKFIVHDDLTEEFFAEAMREVILQKNTFALEQMKIYVLNIEICERNTSI